MGHNKFKSSDQASKIKVLYVCHGNLKEGARRTKQGSQGRRGFSWTSEAKEDFDKPGRHPSPRKEGVQGNVGLNFHRQS